MSWYLATFWGKFKLVLDHSETVMYTVVQLVSQYQHKFSHCDYFNQKIIKFQVIRMSKDEYYPVAFRTNKYVADV